MNIEEERTRYEEKKRSKLEKFVSPDINTRKEIRKTLNDSAYFIIIGLISLLVIFLPPLFTGCLAGEIGLAFPKNAAGWILWCTCNISTAIANISLLVLFKLQAKKNCRRDENFVKANDILHRLAGEKEVFIPRSPHQMNMADYSKKVVAIVFSTLAASITLTSLILSFAWMTLLSCLVSVIISLILGWTTMIRNEEYWCEEYILYAQMVEKKVQEAKEQELEAAKEAVVPEEPEKEDKECLISETEISEISKSKS